MNIATLSALLIATLADPITWICSLPVAFFARWAKWPIALLFILIMSWPISFVRGHWIESAKYQTTVAVDFGYEAYNAIRGTRFEDHFMKFTGVRNRENAEAFKVQFDRDVKDCATLLGATKATKTAFPNSYHSPPNGRLTSGAGLLSDCNLIGRNAGALAAFFGYVLCMGDDDLNWISKAADRYRNRQLTKARTNDLGRKT